MTAEPHHEARSRYPGTRPFSDSPEDVSKFFGRAEEIEQIHLRVLSVPLLVQFGRSGLGKTSLLQAGLFPRLRKKPFLPVMVRFNNEKESLTAAVTRAIAESCAAEGLQFDAVPAPGLWELLSDLTVWRGELLLTPVLVFDQFEEVFTLRDAAFREELSAELGALATGVRPARITSPDYNATPDVKIVISLREDYLGALEEFSAAIPGLFHERLRLEALRESFASAAITKPAGLSDDDGGPYDSPQFEFEPAALDAMIEYLKGTSGVIEPFQLQLLSRHAEKIATAKSTNREKVTITLADFHDGRDFPTVLEHFYRNTLGAVHSPAQRRKAEQLCEEGLIDADGHRLMLEERQILGREYGLSRETLHALCDERLLRREKRQESVFYEISHDRLAASIRASRPIRVPRKWRRILWVAAVSAAVIVAVLFIYSRRVQNERDSAERLLSFLLGEEFLGQVRASGRTELLELVQSHVDIEGGHRTDVNRGLSIRNHGDINRNSGQILAAVADFSQALELFDSESNDPDIVREAARTHERLGEMLIYQGRLTEARAHVDSAARDWRRVIGMPREAPDEEMTRDCTSLASVLVASASLRNRVGDAKALDELRSAYAIASNLLFGPHGGECASQAGGLDPYPDPEVLRVMALVISQRAEILQSYDDYHAATVLMEEAWKLTPTSAAMRREKLVSRGISSVVLGGNAEQRLTIDQRRAMLKEFDDLRRWDPENRDWQRDRVLMQTYIVSASAVCQQDPQCTPKPSLDDAEALGLEALATARALAKIDPSSVYSEDTLLWAMETHAYLLDVLGNHSGALAHLEEAEKIRAGSAAVHEPNDVSSALDRNRRLRAQAKALAGLNRLPEAKKKLEEALALVPPDSNTAAQVDALLQTRQQETTILALVGDEEGTRRAAEEAERLVARYLAITAAPRNEVRELDTRLNEHFIRGFELFKADKYADALKEFHEARSLERDLVSLDPGLYFAYDYLRNVHDWIQETNRFLKRDKERTADLRAAMYAGQIAAWLAPPADPLKQKEMKENLFRIRNDFTSYLSGTANAPEDALVMANEAVTVAELLVQDPDPRFASAFGVAKCSLGRLRRKLNVIGWEEALSSGLIYINRAETAGTDNFETAKQWGACRMFLADALAARNDHPGAAEQFELAIKDYALASQLASWDEDAKNGEAEARRKAAANQR